MAGIVEALLVKVCDKVSEGSPVLQLHGKEEGTLTQPPSLLSQQEPAPAPDPPSKPTGAPPGMPAQLGATAAVVGAGCGFGAR